MNDIVCGTSTGLSPIGIIDDVRQSAFITTQVDEEVIFGPDLIGAPDVVPGGLITTHDVMTTLQNPSIVKHSFVSDYPVIINYKNGVAKIPKGSFLNYASVAGGGLDSIRIIVSYAYQVPDLPGEDTTVGSGRITVWCFRMVASTDQYDTTMGYPLNCPLYCGLDSKFTSKQPTPNHPQIAICIGPPTAINNMLDFIFL